MYDQGEDRWLCTLMLLTGGRIEYEAGSHCLTFAPEELGIVMTRLIFMSISEFLNHMICSISYSV